MVAMSERFADFPDAELLTTQEAATRTLLEGGTLPVIGRRAQQNQQLRPQDSLPMQIQESTEAAQQQIGAATTGAQEAITQGLGASQAQLDPFRTGGQAAFQQQQALLGLGGPEAQAAARQQLFGSQEFLGAQDEGTRRLERQLSATGQLGSGARLSELTRLNANLRNQFLGQRLGQLGQLSGLGFGAAQQGAGQQFQGGLSQADLGFRGGLAGAETGLQGSGQQLQFQLGLMGAEQANEALRAQQRAAEGQQRSQLGSLVGAGIGTAFGGPIGGAIGGGLGGALFSDKRLKESIEFIGEFNGHKWYEYNYIWDKVKRLGVMAQEVMKYNPEAVKRHESGYLMVLPEAL